jgi:hypothetical protein
MTRKQISPMNTFGSRLRRGLTLKYRYLESARWLAIYLQKVKKEGENNGVKQLLHGKRQMAQDGNWRKEKTMTMSRKELQNVGKRMRVLLLMSLTQKSNR